MLKVSVLLITYNHENFIAQALDSVLMQEVDFDYEIVIGEDCSKDKTRDILLKYKESYPEKIRLIFRGKNIGAHKNFETAYDECKGSYIAYLDGDDYWLSKNKLQTQVDFLDKNSKTAECFHPVNVVSEDSNSKSYPFPTGLEKQYFDIVDVLQSFFIPTSSVMFRSSAIKRFPPWCVDVANSDWVIHILCAMKGNIAFIDDIFGVYRIHSQSMWSSQDWISRVLKTVHSASIIRKHLKREYRLLLNNRICRGYFTVAKHDLCSLSFIALLKHFMLSVVFYLKR